MLPSRLWIGFLTATISWLLPWAILAQPSDEDDSRDRAIVDRFASVLEKNPRRGTAFDKVYAYHLDRGSLESILKEWRDRATAANGLVSARTWMIVGLFEARRGQDSVAIDAFTRAESLDAANPMAPYYLGQSLAALGKSDKAAEAFERALSRNPVPMDLLDIYQSLGRIHQRAQRHKAALDVWNRLEQHFPNDARVEEQIATLLVEEGDFASALPRFEKLARSARERNLKTQFQVEVAEIKARLDRKDEATRDFEQILSQLNPDNWLYRDVRTRIEGLFLRSGDSTGLIDYYKRWVTEHPQDLEVIARLARRLSAAGQSAEARKWLEQALKLAPSKTELRQTLISQLINERQFSEAVEQFKLLDKLVPNNPDTLREWGRVVLKDTSRELPSRQEEAATIWRRLLAIRPNDPSLMSQTADLFRHADMTDAALELYRKAIETAPDASQYREYLGEYLHSLKRTDEALAVWREIVAGDRMTAANAARLAEVLAGFGYVDEAIKANSDACRLDPRNFDVQLKQVDLLSRANQHEQALGQIAVVERLAATDEEREVSLQRELSELQAMDRLDSRMTEILGPLQKDQSNTKESAARWYWMARAYELIGKTTAAAQAIGKATERDPSSIPILRTAARLFEHDRNLREAVKIQRKLAEVAPRFRYESLKRLVALELRLGNKQQAMQAGRDLLAAVPNNPEVTEFFSDLCFQLHQPDEGIQALRRMLRINPAQADIVIKLASALMENNQSHEATELLTQAFDRSSHADERFLIVQHLAKAHSKSGTSPKLYARLEKERQAPGNFREMTRYLAAAHEACGDLLRAHEILESTLTEDSQDTDLLEHLVSIAERQRLFPVAVGYQKKLVAITNDRRDRFRLSHLMMMAGMIDDALDTLQYQDGKRELSKEFLLLMATLLQNGNSAVAIPKIRELREQFPANWELMYLEGSALAASRPDEASNCFEAILALNADDDEPSIIRKSRNGMTGIQTKSLPLYERFRQFNQFRSPVRVAVPRPGATASSATPPGTVNSPAGGTFNPAPATVSSRLTTTRSGQRAVQPAWTPEDYGTARIAAWFCLLKNRHDSNKDLNQYASDRVKELAEVPGQRSLVDQLSIHWFIEDVTRKRDTARQLFRAFKDADSAAVLLNCLVDRRTARTPVAIANNAARIRMTIPPGQPALDDETLADVNAAYQVIEGRADLQPVRLALLEPVIDELRYAKRNREADRLLDQNIQHLSSREEASRLLELSISPMEPARTVRILQKLCELETASLGKSPSASPVATPEYIAQTLHVGMTSSSATVDQLLDVWDAYLKWQALTFVPGVGNRSSRRPPSTLTAAANIGLLGSQAPQDLSSRLALVPPGGLNRESQDLLSLLAERFKAANNGDVLVTFQSRAKFDSLTLNERLLSEQSLGYLLWISGFRKDAIEAYARGADVFPEWLELRLHGALLHELSNQPVKALQIADALQFDSNELRKQQETLILRVAIATREFERARHAASRLVDWLSPTEDVVPLCGRLIELRMLDEADRLVERGKQIPRPTNPPDYRLRQVEMNLRLAEQRFDEANVIAEKFLNDFPLDGRMTPATTPNNPQAMIVQTSVNGQRVAVALTPDMIADYRKDALRILTMTGKLAQMIELKEAELKRSPGSKPVITALADLHRAAGNRVRADELTATADARLNNALALLQNGRPQDAVDRIQSLIDFDPEFLGQKWRDVMVRFHAQGELPRLATMLEQHEHFDLSRWTEAFNTLMGLLSSSESGLDIAKRMFLNEWKSKPARRVDILVKIPSDWVWKQPEVRQFAHFVLIFANQQNSATQWEVYGREIAASSDPLSRTFVSQILDVVEEDQQLDQLTTNVEMGLRNVPDWITGRLLLVLIDARRGRINEVRKALTELSPPLIPAVKSRPFVCWEIARELARKGELIDLALQYEQLAIDGLSSQLGAVRKNGLHLAEWLMSQGRPADARRVLVQSTPVTLRFGEKAANPAAADFLQLEWLVTELKRLGFRMDAIQVSLIAIRKTEGIRIPGRDPRLPLLIQVYTMVNELTPDTFVEWLETREEGEAPLDLLLHIAPSADGPSLQSRLQGVFNGISKAPKISRRCESALKRMISRDQGDMTPLILAAVLAMESGDPQWKKTSTDALVAAVEKREAADRKLEQAQDTSRPTETIDEREVALWLVARHCLRDPSLTAAGKLFGKRAIQHSQNSLEWREEILNEWIQIDKPLKDESTGPNPPK